MVVVLVVVVLVVGLLDKVVVMRMVVQQVEKVSLFLQFQFHLYISKFQPLFHDLPNHQALESKKDGFIKNKAFSHH